MTEYSARTRPKPLVVIILDGWGISLLKKGNAIAAADTPTMDTYARTYPSATISAAGIEVGLPIHEVGNSETGHRNIGAGKVQYQVLPKIDKAILDGSFFTNPVFLDAINHVTKHGSTLHLMGLTSPGGVHSHLNHLVALLELCAKQNMKNNVYIHIFTDGRDSPKMESLGYIQTIEQAIQKFSVGEIASVTGRFYAMDRNKNWNRTEAAYNILTGGVRQAGAPTAAEAIAQSYKQEVFDEQIPPTAITRGGENITKIQDNDAVLFFNYRPDRARQITQAFVAPEKVDFPAKKFQNLFFATMTQYDPSIPTPYAFTEDVAPFPLARVISDAGLTQFHIAETEKYAHITYYLNVGNETPYTGETRELIRSSNVDTFADEPNMQAEKITDRVVEEVASGTYDVYFINFANADMVGHTGNFDATVTACSHIDTCITRIHNAVFEARGVLLITADHGNAEEKIDVTTGRTQTGHTRNPVPLHLVAPNLQRITPKSDDELATIFTAPVGVLADIAPTILDILHIAKPQTMTGVSLLPSLR
ncbi:MAG TPA: 2,3-bisphosphoglycerate-independent phosphoglycerate mutase [Candidatus Andersenbacteria bacterium]|nr:2,3-bisphosphoglycerate-independent phosphoglycerate mutase [Candidatus Andersenbacteria bacterium]